MANFDFVRAEKQLNAFKDGVITAASGVYRIGEVADSVFMTPISEKPIDFISINGLEEVGEYMEKHKKKSYYIPRSDGITHTGMVVPIRGYKNNIAFVDYDDL